MRVLQRADRAKFTGRVHVAGYGYFLKFHHPKYQKPFVKFPASSIVDTVRVTRGTSSADVRAANKMRGKRKGYTWHHDTERGLLQLIPTPLHEAAYPHTGGNAIHNKGR